MPRDYNRGSKFKTNKRELLLHQENEINRANVEDIPGNVLSLAPPLPVDVALTNAVVGGDMQSASPWIGLNGTISVSGGVLSIVGNGSDTTPYVQQNNVIPYVSGSKVLVVTKVKVTNSVCQNISFRVGATGMTTVSGTAKASPVNGEVYTIPVVLTVGAGGSGNISVRIAHTYADAATANGKVMEVEEVMCIDLTTPFTAGKEPTVTQLQRAMGDTTFFNGTRTFQFDNYETYFKDLWKDKSRGYEVSLENAVTKGKDFIDTTGWSGLNGVVSVASGILSVTGNGTNTNVRLIGSTTAIPFSIGRRVFAYVEARVTNSVCTAIIVEARDVTHTNNPACATITNPVANQWYPISGIAPLNTTTNFVVPYIRHGYVDAATANGKVMEVRTVLYTDLTAAFGATREPSIADITLAMTEAGTTFWNGAKTLRFRNNATLSNFAGSATSGWVNEWIECQTGESKEVVNLLGAAGDFEGASVAALGYGVVGSPEISTTVVKTGTKSLKCFGAVSTLATATVNAPTGNKLYACVFAYITRRVVGEANIIAFDKGGIANGVYGVGINQTLLNTWQFSSLEKVSANGGAFFYCGNSGSANMDSYMDDFIVLDKTTIFGPGNEPTQSEMDKIVQRAIAAYGYISTKTLKLAKRWMLRGDGTDDFGAITNSPQMDLGVVAGREQAWAVVFRTSVLAGYLVCKNNTLGTDAQYGINLDGFGANLNLNGANRVNTGVLQTNEFYSLIFYRNKLGVITPILNSIDKPTTTYANALTSQPNMRICRRETAAAYFKGDLVYEGAWEADTLNIEQIKRSVNNIARNYLA